MGRLPPGSLAPAGDPLETPCHEGRHPRPSYGGPDLVTPRGKRLGSLFAASGVGSPFPDW
jgi:hypothetical protein